MKNKNAGMQITTNANENNINDILLSVENISGTLLSCLLIYIIIIANIVLTSIYDRINSMIIFQNLQKLTLLLHHLL